MAKADTKHRLGELVLYIASKMEGNPTFGATKLNKVLFYCDFLWHRDNGASISGAKYQKLDHGPAPVELLPALDLLKHEGAVEIEQRRYLTKMQTRVRAKREADLNLFSPQQIALVDGVIEWLGQVSATELSEFTHQHLGWRLARYGEEIPYHTVHLSDKGALSSDIKRGEELAREHGWLANASCAM